MSLSHDALRPFIAKARDDGRSADVTPPGRCAMRAALGQVDGSSLRHVISAAGCGRIGYDPVDVDIDASAGGETQGDEIYVEAESGALDAPLRVVADSTASSGSYVIDDPQPGGQTQGQATYQVEITRADSYRLWARTRGSDTGAGSFSLSMNGEDSIVFPLSTESSSQDWQWIPVTGGSSLPLEFELEIGTHELVFTSREPQSILDVFVITTVTDFQPQQSLLERTQ